VIERLDEQKTIEAIQDWIRNYIAGVGASGVVVGLSGGVDSSLVAALCVGALGANRVRGLILDCESSKIGAEHAREVAKTFGIATEQIDLFPTFKTLELGALSGHLRSSKMARANTKSRLRMVALYAVANAHNLLVVGTTNLTEDVLGYFTKYGDGGIDIEPIMGLLKGEVRQLARVKGVPEAIITKAPSAGLWEGQTDEEELGASYDDLDKIVYAISEGDTIPEGLEDLHKKVLDIYQRTQHKREIPPSGAGLLVFQRGT